MSYLVGGSEHAPLAGILVNQLLLLASIVLLTGLIPNGGTAPLREQPGFWLLISPFAFFFSTMYTESLFLFLSLVMVLASRRHYHGIAFTAGVLAGLARPTAILLPLLLISEVIDALRRRCDQHDLQILAAVGFAVGDPLGNL